MKQTFHDFLRKLFFREKNIVEKLFKYYHRLPLLEQVCFDQLLQQTIYTPIFVQIDNDDGQLSFIIDEFHVDEFHALMKLCEEKNAQKELIHSDADGNKCLKIPLLHENCPLFINKLLRMSDSKQELFRINAAVGGRGIVDENHPVVLKMDKFAFNKQYWKMFSIFEIIWQTARFGCISHLFFRLLEIRRFLTFKPIVNALIKRFLKFETNVDSLVKVKLDLNEETLTEVDIKVIEQTEQLFKILLIDDFECYSRSHNEKDFDSRIIIRLLCDFDCNCKHNNECTKCLIEKSYKHFLETLFRQNKSLEFTQTEKKKTEKI